MASLVVDVWFRDPSRIGVARLSGRSTQITYILLSANEIDSVVISLANNNIYIWFGYVYHCCIDLRYFTHAQLKSLINNFDLHDNLKNAWNETLALEWVLNQ